MPDLIHQFISRCAEVTPDAPALLFKKQSFSYAQLQHKVETVAGALLALGVESGGRVGVYLPKRPETVFSLFGAAAAGACFVPINPLLKARQLAHILPHCNISVLITSHSRLEPLLEVLKSCPDLHTIVLLDEQVPVIENSPGQKVLSFADFCATASGASPHERIDTDMAAILYTSGSTGDPKGVILSHRNLVMGARSVTSYLDNSAKDRLLAVLPLSFDAGLSQLTTAFAVGASVALIDYLVPRDVIKAVARYSVTGLSAVPPLWIQLSSMDWPPEAVKSLRYITNTGGAMPVATTRGLQQRLPDTLIYLMYGLTEAFRSTYLPPEQVNARPESIGIAIPNVQIMVVNDKGLECAPNEPGELVHGGALVSLGYWNDPQQTAQRFRPWPGQPSESRDGELAVWSGDQVMRDEEGYLYFITREDDLIKTSGYRVSPTEVEGVAMSSGLITSVAALGIPHARLGQAILLTVTTSKDTSTDTTLTELLLAHCRVEMPNFMVPGAIVVRPTLPHNQNGKIDRHLLAQEYRLFFQDQPP